MNIRNAAEGTGQAQMIRKVKIPKLSTNVEEVTITAWHCAEGAMVKRGDPLVELTTSKASFDLESPCRGMVRKILARPKSSLPTGYIIALIGSPSDAVPDVTAFNRKILERHRLSNASPRKISASAPSKAATSFSPSEGAIRATPAARRLAREKNVNLATIKKSTSAEILTEEIVAEYIRKTNKQ